MKKSPETIQEKDLRITRELKGNLGNGKAVDTKIETDQRVIARITDGIYRKPSSALRELISNAYDADATEVHISTDAPQFKEIRISDNGHGMSEEGLVNLIHHIGGSLKRTKRGSQNEYNITGADSNLSPLGRPLIGKIGIGLFSIAQLTRHFHIITKQKSTNHRLIAEVVLTTFSEEDLLDSDGTNTYEAGKVRIWSEKANDKESHGTEIILNELEDYALDQFQSKDLWKDNDADADEDEILPSDRRNSLACHIGYVKDGEIKAPAKNDAWDKNDKAGVKIEKLYRFLVNGTEGRDRPTPQKVFDIYYQTIWDLCLASPVEYVSTHPFELTDQSGLEIYHLDIDAGKGDNAVKKLDLHPETTIRTQLELKNEEFVNKLPFCVYIDDIQLKRPIAFSGMPMSSAASQDSLLFVGKIDKMIENEYQSYLGGQLSFEAYFFMPPKIAPINNNGVMIRVRNSSGTLFDQSFLSFPVSETRRLSRLSVEILVNEGLDAALNIDRESFNQAHPHFVLLTNWLHWALRRVINTDRKIGKAAVTKRKEKEETEERRHLESIVKNTKKRKLIPYLSVEKTEDRPSVIDPEQLLHKTEEKVKKHEKKNFAIAPTQVFFDEIDIPPEKLEVLDVGFQVDKKIDPSVFSLDLESINELRKISPQTQEIWKTKIETVVQLMDVYGLLEKLSEEKKELEHFLNDLIKVFNS